MGGGRERGQREERKTGRRGLLAAAVKLQGSSENEARRLKGGLALQRPAQRAARWIITIISRTMRGAFVRQSEAERKGV